MSMSIVLLSAHYDKRCVPKLSELLIDGSICLSESVIDTCSRRYDNPVQKMRLTRMELKPLNIGGITIDTPLTLAPMAGQTNHALRWMCRSYGDCGLVCTELLSSMALSYESPKAYAMFDWQPREHPFAVQLFGADPQVMAEAAKKVVDDGAAIVDINMGCWVPKIAKGGAGAALLKDVCTATAVVEAVVKAVPVPVTVKVRAGWEEANPTAVEFARAAE